MARAILEGRKTMTRRVIKPQPVALGDEGRRTSYSWRGGIYALQFYPDRSDILDRCPYGQPGDRLWVREAWLYDDYMHDMTEGVPDLPGGAYSHRLVYRASNPDYPMTIGSERWHPSIHMPRWASRILLEIASVRVERVQDISDTDAEREGVGGNDPGGMLSFREHFRELWDSINAKRGYGWDTNPWVWVVEFKKVDP